MDTDTIPIGAPPPRHFNMAAYCVGRAASAWPDKAGLILAHGTTGAADTWTFAEIDDAVRRTAAGLIAQGLRPGDRVMIRLGNTSAFPIVYFGAMAVGVVAIPTSAQLTPREAGMVLRDSDARALVFDPDLPVEDLPDDVLTLTGAALSDLRHYPPATYADTDADAPAFLVYTSGTSGRSKGVLHAHRSAWGRRPMYADWYGISANDVMLHAGAFNWTYTLGAGLADPWANGATSVIYDGPKNPTVWPALIDRFGATLFAAVPTVYRQILKYAPPTRDAIPSLRHALTAGEALRASLHDAWVAATGRPLYEALGMSEISTYVSSGPNCPTRPGSPGRPQQGRRIAVLPIDGGETPLPAGEIGLLAVHRSDPGLMLGYWNRPEEEAAVLRGDWFIGGDLARFDDEGYLWFEGRNDDLMNTFGYRVSPEEVEAAISDHPDVAEVAVTECAVSDDVSIITAFIVPHTGAVPTAESILARAAERLADYKRPRAVVFVDALPRTPSGKVRRKALRKPV